MMLSFGPYSPLRTVDNDSRLPRQLGSKAIRAGSASMGESKGSNSRPSEMARALSGGVGWPVAAILVLDFDSAIQSLAATSFRIHANVLAAARASILARSSSRTDRIESEHSDVD